MVSSQILVVKICSKNTRFLGVPRLNKVDQGRHRQSQPSPASKESKRKKSGVAPKVTETLPKRKNQVQHPEIFSQAPLWIDLMVVPKSKGNPMLLGKPSSL